MKLIKALINSNFYISIAAVFFTVETQIQLGMKPQWHPYLFLIFFATLFEYNLHRLITIVTNKEALNSDKHKWVKENLIAFYLLVFFSISGFIYAAYMAKRDVLITLAPLALITVFYSIPVFGNKKNIFRLREIPYLKIFLIAIVWSFTTILLPVIQVNNVYNKIHIITMLSERFLFIFAITIPFDIRDLKSDKQSGLKTIPLYFNENKSMVISYFSLLFFFLITIIHNIILNYQFIIWAFGISALTTFIFLQNKRIKNLNYYYYGILDGTILLQGLLVMVCYYLKF